jgi:hypothetical protein
MSKTTVQQVAGSLDAFIAAPNGECDWIAMAHRSISTRPASARHRRNRPESRGLGAGSQIDAILIRELFSIACGPGLLAAIVLPHTAGVGVAIPL